MDLHVTETGHGYIVMHGPRLYPGHYATVGAAVLALQVDIEVLEQVIRLRGTHPLFESEVRALVGLARPARTMAVWDAHTDSARPPHDPER